MKKMTLLLFFVLLTFGCGAEPAMEAETEAMPAVDAESVRQAILASNEAWKQAALAEDAAAAANLYTDDAVVMPPNAPKVSGRAAIEAGLTEYFQMVQYQDVSISLDQVIVADSGELAYAVGSFRETMAGEGGSTTTNTGNFLATYRNVGGQWKIEADMWVSDQPAAE